MAYIQTLIIIHRLTLVEMFYELIGMQRSDELDIFAMFFCGLIVLFVLQSMIYLFNRIFLGGGS